MTSERMIAANRRNGRRGCGPRTAAGKASSSRNALRHGLSVRLVDGPGTCAEVEKLARIIAGADADDVQLGHARIVAEAQLDLMRIQSAKVAIMNSLIGNVIPSSAAILGDGVTPGSQGGNAGVESDDVSSESCFMQGFATPTILRQLSRLERYERHAISRRRRAMRAFLVLQPFGTNAEL
jgi:hypothetical protein